MERVFLFFVYIMINIYALRVQIRQIRVIVFKQQLNVNKNMFVVSLNANIKFDSLKVVK